MFSISIIRHQFVALSISLENILKKKERKKRERERETNQSAENNFQLLKLPGHMKVVFWKFHVDSISKHSGK